MNVVTYLWEHKTKKKISVSQKTGRFVKPSNEFDKYQDFRFKKIGLLHHRIFQPKIASSAFKSGVENFMLPKKLSPKKKSEYLGYNNRSQAAIICHWTNEPNSFTCFFSTLTTYN